MIAGLDTLPRLHIDRAEVQEGGGQPVPMIDDQRAAGVIQIRVGEGDDPGGGRHHGRTFLGRHIHPEMRSARLTVQDALAAIHSADGADGGPPESGQEVLPVIIAVAGRPQETRLDAGVAAPELDAIMTAAASLKPEIVTP